MSRLEKLYWTAWAVGTAIIAMSWMNVVSNETGWIGFYIAGAATLVSFFRKREARPEREAAVIVTRAMLELKNHAYDDAMKRLRSGGTLVCEGLAITIHGPTIYCSMVASRPIAELDELHALEDGQRGQREFEGISRLSPELAALAQGRVLIVSLVTSYSGDGIVICDVADGKVEWKVPKAAHA